ncbi:MAG: rhodanese-like domain-containing protein [Chloroflexi bacterium]|nr:rhodanese-like domain-containing protein [Chloroflexota bacterium]
MPESRAAACRPYRSTRALLIDVRSAVDYKREHIPGSRLLPLEVLAERRRAAARSAHCADLWNR